MKDLLGRRGFSMLGVMFFALLALVLASTISVMSFAPTALARKHDQSLECENLAASALKSTFARLKQEPGFRGTIRIGDKRAWAVVTFEPGIARSLAVPLSVNLHDSATQAPGSLHRTLPPHSVQLFARAKVGPETLTVEQVLHAPPFEYCIASSSGIVASGPMLVAGVSELEGTELPADLEPGHIAGNGNVALSGPSTRVTGDVKASGTVSRSSGVEIDGRVSEQHSEVALPSIPIAAYDPGTGSAVRVLDPSYPGLTIDGLARCQGDLMLNVSGLELENGLLFVDGNLTVSGGVSGRGAIICTGDVTVNGGGSLSTTNLAAIVARGKVTLNGTAGSRGFFRGLVYTETGMEASCLKLVGAFVHRSMSGSGEMKLTNCDVVFDPEAVKFEWDIPGFGAIETNQRGAAQLADGVTAEDFFDRDTGHFDLSRVDAQSVPFTYRGVVYSSLADAVANQGSARPPRRVNPDGSPGNYYVSWEQFFQESQDHYKAVLSVMDQQYQAKHSEALLRGRFSLDLNQFLNATDSMRVVFWRDLN